MQQRISKRKWRLRVRQHEEFGVRNSVQQCRNRKHKSHQRPASADIKQRAIGANRRAHQNKGAERSNQRRERNEKRIARVNAMRRQAKMTKLVSQKNRKQGQCKR